MAGNEELWEFRAVDAGFVATTQILAAEIDFLKKSSAELTKNFVEGNKKNKLSIEELTAKIAENTEKVRAGSDILRERLKIITDTKQAVIDYTAAIQQSTAAKGPYVPGGTDYMTGRDPVKDQEDAESRKKIASQLTEFYKNQEALRLQDYNDSWRQKIDLDREEAAAKVRNLQDEKRIRDSIEAQKNADFDEKVNRNLRRLRDEKDARLQIERELRDFQIKFADEVAARDKMQFVADTGPEAGDKAQKIAAQRIELFKLERQYEELNKQAAIYKAEAAAGSEVAVKAFAKLQRELLLVEKSMHSITRDLESSHGFRGMRMMFTEGARGAQDFLTVFTMPGMGFTDAFRAASNNIEVMAMSIKGLTQGWVTALTMIPSVIQLGIAVSGWLNKEAEAAAKATQEEIKHTDEMAKKAGSMKDYNQHLKEMNDLRGVQKEKIEGLIEVEGRLIDVRREEMLAENSKALSAAEAATEKTRRTLENLVESAKSDTSREGDLNFGGTLDTLRSELLDNQLKQKNLERQRERINETRDADIAKQTINNAIRPQDEVLKRRAMLEAAAVMEGFATPEGAAGRLAASTGITPKGKDQETFFNNRIKQFLDDQTEGITAKRFSERAEERGMTAEQRRDKDKTFIRSVIDKELEDENLRIQQAKQKKDDFERRVNKDLLPGGRERPFIDGKSTVKTRKDLEQEINNRERERDDERKRLEKSMGLDPVVAMGMLKGINRLVELFERDGAPEIAAAPARARVFGVPMRNPNIAAFEPGMA